MARKKIILNLSLFILIMVQFSVTAQTAYQLTLDSVFDIPKNKITTGVLIERSPNIIDMQGFDYAKTADSNFLKNYDKI